MTEKLQMAFYKGTRPGLAGIYNRAVRAWARGPYSHVELVFPDGIAASASFADGGVRYKRIEFDPGKWDLIELPVDLAPAARAYFDAHEGEGYDILGNVRFLVGFMADGRRKKFCSEACGAAIGIAQAWRFEPNALYCALMRLVRLSQEEGAPA